MSTTEKAPPTTILVSEYFVTRHYGGPEEGGWYYDWWNFHRTMRAFACEEEAFAYCREMNAKADANRENGGLGRYSVFGSADVVYTTESYGGERETRERPYYC